MKKPVKKTIKKTKAAKLASPTEIVENAFANAIEWARKEPKRDTRELARIFLAQYPTIARAVVAQQLLARLTFGLGGFLVEADQYMTACGALPAHLDPVVRGSRRG